MTWPERIGIVKDLIVTLTSLVGATAAIVALWQWRAQHRWRTRHDAALRLMRSLRRLSDAITDARQTIQHVASFRYQEAQGEGGRRPPSRFDPDQAEREARARFWRASERLGSEADEANYLWGEPAGVLLQKVFEVAFEFKTALTLAEVVQPKIQDGEPETWKPRTVYASGADDEFTPRLGAAFGAALEFFRRQL